MSRLSAMSDFPELRVGPPGHQSGLLLGRAFQERIRRALEKSKLVRRRVELDRKEPGVLDSVTAKAEGAFPDYLAELRGVSEGAEVDLRRLLALNFMHLPYRESCSTIVLRRDDRPPSFILGHNEDHDPDIGRDAYLVTYDLGGGRWMTAHCHAGMVPGISFACNSHGLAVACNSLPDPTGALGMPRTLVGRSVMESSTVDEACRRAAEHAPRSGGVSYNVLSAAEGRAVNIETTADALAITEIGDRYYRTNHYISTELGHLPKPPPESTSESRYAAGIDLATTAEPTIDGAWSVLSAPGVHLPTTADFVTTATVVFASAPGLAFALRNPEGTTVVQKQVI